MVKAKKCGVNVPEILDVDSEKRTITMSYVNGVKLKDYLTSQKGVDLDGVLRDVGKNTALLHNDGIIHGDLTTSNIMVQEDKEAKTLVMYFIDFGLSYVKKNLEDFAVDLYVLEKAFVSTHSELEQEVFKQVIIGYEQHSVRSKETLQQFEVVRQRGRKRLAFG